MSDTKQRVISQEEIDQMEEMYNGGVKTGLIAKNLRISERTIRRYSVKKKWKKPTKRKDPLTGYLNNRSVKEATKDMVSEKKPALPALIENIKPGSEQEIIPPTNVPSKVPFSKNSEAVNVSISEIFETDLVLQSKEKENYIKINRLIVASITKELIDTKQKAKNNSEGLTEKDIKKLDMWCKIYRNITQTVNGLHAGMRTVLQMDSKVNRVNNDITEDEMLKIFRKLGVSYDL